VPITAQKIGVDGANLKESGVHTQPHLHPVNSQQLTLTAWVYSTVNQSIANKNNHNNNSFSDKEKIKPQRGKQNHWAAAQVNADTYGRRN
jgi:hypothetical protein